MTKIEQCESALKLQKENYKALRKAYDDLLEEYTQSDKALRDEMEATERIDAKTIKNLQAENMSLIKIIWIRHAENCGGLHALYGDDGEMQCNKCMKDFKRMNANELLNQKDNE